MKKIQLCVIIAALCITLAGCAASDPAPAEKNDTVSPEVSVVDPSVQEEQKGAASESEENVSAPEEQKEIASEAGDDVAPPEDNHAEQDEAGEDDSDETAPVKGQPIVWLGDSLTQGSLGDENDNLPGAPYEKLRSLVNVPVEGYGYYGWNTHDVLWVYTDKGQLGQMADPHKTYIFWLGSNDWVVDGESNSNTEPVIKEIDRFLHLEGNIPNYIVMGTTSRHRLGDLYIPINHDLEEHYKEHYMDVIDIINRYGYSPDNTHLSQECYDAVAEAVYEKLKELGYI